MTSSIQQQLNALEAMFEAKIPGKMEEINQTWQLVKRDPGNKDHFVSLHRILHTLAGSAGAFGFSEVGTKASQLESRFSALIKSDTHDSSTLAQLEFDLNAYIVWCLSTTKVTQTVTMPAAPVSLNTETSEKPIYLVNEDTDLATDMAIQLEHYGYDAVIIHQYDQLSTAIERQAPVAVIMDMMIDPNTIAGALEIARIRKSNVTHFPCIFLATGNTFAARLAAVKAGADGYFSKPVDMLSLTDRLDALTAKREATPFKILIMDDDHLTAEYYSTILKGAGMDVHTLHQPNEIFSALSEFQPDLVLMDVYMPQCSGVELAKLIRQENRYLDMPIVFLSSEEDLGKQLDAISSGADDFLTKPIQPRHLISSITSRAERHRALHSLIMRDSLTQLYNHSAIKDQLAREMARAKRAGSELSLAMIDLDHFKSVNDTYGHPVGDHVIRALSRLLQQRLRRSDIVGRYGGEEFAVIFPNSSASAALGVLDKVRIAFSKIRHQAENTEFSSTFSAGIVDMGAISDTEEMFIAADEGLYSAKQNGRDRIALARNAAVSDT